jgi:hypothetical protein
MESTPSIARRRRALLVCGLPIVLLLVIAVIASRWRQTPQIDTAEAQILEHRARALAVVQRIGREAKANHGKAHIKPTDLILIESHLSEHCR